MNNCDVILNCLLPNSYIIRTFKNIYNMFRIYIDLFMGIFSFNKM